MINAAGAHLYYYSSIPLYYYTRRYSTIPYPLPLHILLSLTPQSVAVSMDLINATGALLYYYTTIPDYTSLHHKTTPSPHPPQSVAVCTDLISGRTALLLYLYTRRYSTKPSPLTPHTLLSLTTQSVAVSRVGRAWRPGRGSGEGVRSVRRGGAITVFWLWLRRRWGFWQLRWRRG